MSPPLWLCVVPESRLADCLMGPPQKHCTWLQETRARVGTSIMEVTKETERIKSHKIEFNWVEGLGEDGFLTLSILYYPVIDGCTGCRVTTPLTPECTIFPTNILLFLADIICSPLWWKWNVEMKPGWAGLGGNEFWLRRRAAWGGGTGKAFKPRTAQWPPQCEGEF